MTFSTRNPFNPYRRSGFTLVEMLVVIGIMLVLMGLLLPALNRAYKSAVRDRMAADLQAISTALEAYRQDFDAYPPVPSAPATYSGDGAFILCWALMGPADKDYDGADKLGFKVRAGGKTWGPYLPTDRIKMGDWTQQIPSSASPNNNVNFCLLDRNQKPILYYPGRRGVDITVSQGFMGPTGMFNPNDNTAYGMAATTFQILMGDIGSGHGPGAPNGVIDPSVSGYPPEAPAYTGNYVLWSAGPDENFGPPDPTQPPSPHNRCDDVANFPRGEY